MLLKNSEPGIKTVTKVFPLKYHSVPNSKMTKEVESSLESGAQGGDIVASIKEILSEEGKVTEDTRTNSLIITDLPARLPIVEAVVSLLDTPAAQAMLEVEILDVSKGTVDKLGVSWPAILAKLDVTGARATSFPFWGSNNWYDLGGMMGPEETAGGWENVLWPTDHFGPSILTIIGAELTMEFLKAQTDTKTLARPRILTLNNETAEIKITTDEVIGVRRTEEEEGGQGTVTYEAERAETGISLRVTPQINPETGEITMFIVPTVSDANRSLLSGGEFGDFWNPETRSTKSVVRVKDGETVVLGGLIRKASSESRSKVPVLGDIHAMVAANEVGGKKLIQMMEDYQISDLNDLSAAIIELTFVGESTPLQQALEEIARCSSPAETQNG